MKSPPSTKLDGRGGKEREKELEERRLVARAGGVTASPSFHKSPSSQSPGVDDGRGGGETSLSPSSAESEGCPVRVTASSVNPRKWSRQQPWLTNSLPSSSSGGSGGNNLAMAGSTSGTASAASNSSSESSGDLLSRFSSELSSLGTWDEVRTMTTKSVRPAAGGCGLKIGEVDNERPAAGDERSPRGCHCGGGGIGGVDADDAYEKIWGPIHQDNRNDDWLRKALKRPLPSETSFISRQFPPPPSCKRHKTDAKVETEVNTQLPPKARGRHESGSNNKNIAAHASLISQPSSSQSEKKMQQAQLQDFLSSSRNFCLQLSPRASSLTWEGGDKASSSRSSDDCHGQSSSSDSSGDDSPTFEEKGPASRPVGPSSGDSSDDKVSSLSSSGDQCEKQDDSGSSCKSAALKWEDELLPGGGGGEEEHKKASAVSNTLSRNASPCDLADRPTTGVLQLKAKSALRKDETPEVTVHDHHRHASGGPSSWPKKKRKVYHGPAGEATRNFCISLSSRTVYSSSLDCEGFSEDLQKDAKSKISSLSSDYSQQGKAPDPPSLHRHRRLQRRGNSRALLSDGIATESSTLTLSDSVGGNNVGKTTEESGTQTTPTSGSGADTSNGCGATADNDAAAPAPHDPTACKPAVTTRATGPDKAKRKKQKKAHAMHHRYGKWQEPKHGAPESAACNFCISLSSRISRTSLLTWEGSSDDSWRDTGSKILPLSSDDRQRALAPSVAARHASCNEDGKYRRHHHHGEAASSAVKNVALESCTCRKLSLTWECGVNSANSSSEGSCQKGSDDGSRLSSLSSDGNDHAAVDVPQKESSSREGADVKLQSSTNSDREADAAAKGDLRKKTSDSSHVVLDFPQKQESSSRECDVNSTISLEGSCQKGDDIGSRVSSLSLDDGNRVIMDVPQKQKSSSKEGADVKLQSNEGGDREADGEAKGDCRKKACDSSSTSGMEDDEDTSILPSSTSSDKTRLRTFPDMLFHMLNEEALAGMSQSISWLPNGKGFTVFCPDKFIHDVLPKYFPPCKYDSFVRKLFRWGFRKSDAVDIFQHKYFLRSNRKLCQKMKSTVAPRGNKKKRRKEADASGGAKAQARCLQAAAGAFLPDFRTGSSIPQQGTVVAAAALSLPQQLHDIPQSNLAQHAGGSSHGSQVTPQQVQGVPQAGATMHNPTAAVANFLYLPQTQPRAHVPPQQSLSGANVLIGAAGAGASMNCNQSTAQPNIAIVPQTQSHTHVPLQQSLSGASALIGVAGAGASVSNNQSTAQVNPANAVSAALSVQQGQQVQQAQAQQAAANAAVLKVLYPRLFR